MAVEPRASSTPSPLTSAPADPATDASRRADTRALARDIPRRFSVVVPAINLVEAALTYVFIVYVVPLPGHTHAHARRTTLIAMVVITALAWVACELWGRHVFSPVKQWLLRGGDPDESVRTRTVRIPLHQAAQTLVVWTLAAAGFGVISALDLNKSAAAGALVAAMVTIGGLVASDLTYLAAERMMRPVTALALERSAPECPLVPGVATRVFLAWEFGTAVAVGATRVTAPWKCSNSIVVIGEGTDANRSTAVSIRPSDSPLVKLESQ